MRKIREDILEFTIDFNTSTTIGALRKHVNNPTLDDDNLVDYYIDRNWEGDIDGIYFNVHKFRDYTSAELAKILKDKTTAQEILTKALLKEEKELYERLKKKYEG